MQFGLILISRGAREGEQEEQGGRGGQHGRKRRTKMGPRGPRETGRIIHFFAPPPVGCHFKWPTAISGMARGTRGGVMLVGCKLVLKPRKALGHQEYARGGMIGEVGALASTLLAGQRCTIVRRS